MVTAAWPELTFALWQQIGIVALWLGAIVLAAEGLDRFVKAEPEIVRKVVHIGVGNVILLAWWLHIPLWLGVIASLLASAIALLSYRFTILRSVNSVGRKSYGTFFYAISFGVLIAWFWSIDRPQYAALGLLVMTWGDGLAAIVGQRFGKHRYKLWDEQKSWEGSIAMALVSYTMSGLIFFGLQGNSPATWLIPIPIAIIATLLEACSKYGVDNLTVPIGSAAIAFVLDRLWLG
ncbi:diacylglycerol/polyprenol kinase family protein [Microcoleus sp. FACHB-1515]|uniref:diacylglycerol/polyprenol kinase family protein n=1 Tax=Microcoleus sp. FACHB-1515 TaxID=2692821 RepID=UPI00329D9608